MTTDNIKTAPMGQLTAEEFKRLTKAKLIMLRKGYGFNQPEWNPIFKKFLGRGVKGSRVEGDRSNITMDMLWVICKVFQLSPAEFFDFRDVPDKYIDPKYGRRK